MQTKSYISAATLAAALFAIPQLTLAQGLGLDLGGIGVDANVDVGGDSLLDVDAGVNLGGDDGFDADANVTLGGSTGDDSGSGAGLIDVDLDLGNAGTGPNGGALIDLGGNNSGEAALDVDVDVLDGTKGNSRLINGEVRIGSLSDEDARAGALLGLIHSPNLADIDLDAAINDRLVSIIAAADLFGPTRLADIRAAVEAGGDGRAELLAALSASVELGSILDKEGINVEDVLAVQISDNGATDIIVLGHIAHLALLGDNGNLADLTAAELANFDIDLLSPEELAEIDVTLLPDDLRTTAQLRLLGHDDELADPSTADLAEADLGLAAGGAPAAKASVGLMGDDGSISFANLTVDELAESRIALVTGDGADDSDGDGVGGGDGRAVAGGTNTDAGAGGGGTSGNGDDGGAAETDSTDANAAIGDDSAQPVGTLPATRVGAGFAIAMLDCGTGVVALATGVEATPQAIAGAQSLELVQIDGCQRTLVDVEADGIRAAVATNPAISAVLDDASIPLDQVIGATIQGGTLTLFIEPTVS